METKGKESSYFRSCSFVPGERTGCDKEKEYNLATFFRVCVYKGDILKSKAKAVWCGQDSSLQNSSERSLETNRRIVNFWKKKNENGSCIFVGHAGSAFAQHNSEIFRHLLKFVDTNKIESLALPLSLTGNYPSIFQKITDLSIGFAMGWRPSLSVVLRPSCGR